MLIALIVIFSYLCTQIQVRKTGSCFDKQTANGINGVCVLLIYLSHFAGYLQLSQGMMDTLYQYFNLIMGQLIVVPFLFFSGYGVFEQYKSKNNYLDTFPKKRILKTLMHFDIAVIVYIVVNMCFGRFPSSAKQVILILLGWENAGNSSWYIFAILCCYFAFFIAAKLCYDKKEYIVIVTSLLIFAYILVISFFKEHSWYNVALVFSAGIYCSYRKDTVERWISNRNNKVLCFIVCIFCVAYGVAYGLSNVEMAAVPYAISYSIAGSMLMVLLLKLFSAFKFRVGGLTWLGQHAFSIYIFQRLPINIAIGLVRTLPWYVTSIICFAITIVIACVFDWLIKKLDSVVLD